MGEDAGGDTESLVAKGEVDDVGGVWVGGRGWRGPCVVGLVRWGFWRRHRRFSSTRVELD
jgi:hypothetical protein